MARPDPRSSVVPDALPASFGGEQPRRYLGEMAWILAVVHLACVVGTHQGVLLHAEPTTLRARQAALADFPVGWTLAWGGWILASFTLLGWFLFALWELGAARISRTAVWLAALATVVGIAARVFLCGGLPLVATLEEPATFAQVERFVWSIELVPTRLLQAATVVLGTAVLARAGLVGRAGVALAVLHALAALALAAAEVAGAHAAALLAVGPETVLLSAWAPVVAVQVRRRLGQVGARA